MTAWVAVWDPVVRVFHWTLVVGIALAYWTSHAGMQETHMVLGYLLAGLLLARIAWGVVGTASARFASFSFSPRVILRYLASMAAGHPRRYLGHSPAAGAMVFALLSVLVVTAVSGIAVAGVVEFEGPFAALLRPVPDEWAYLLRGIHAAAVNVLVGLMVLHLIGVVTASLQHRENLVWAMVTGLKRRDD